MKIRTILTIAVLFTWCQIGESTSETPTGQFTIYHWGDIHSHNYPWIDEDGELVGGYAHIAGLIKEQRALGNEPLVLVNGGEFTGSPLSSITEGASQVRILNSIKPSAFAIGSSEFAYGWRTLQRRLAKAKFPTLLSNVRVAQSNERPFEEHLYIEHQGVKIRIISLIDKDFVHSVPYEGVFELDVSDPINFARNFVNRYRDNTDVLIAMTYLGWKGDSLLAQTVRGLDLIIGGNNKKEVHPPSVINGTMISHSGPHGKFVSRLDLEFKQQTRKLNLQKAELIPITTIIPEDKSIDRLIRRLERRHTRKLDRQIGRLEVDLVKRTDAPCNLAQFTVSAIHTFAPSSNFAVISNNALGKSIRRGYLRERDVWEIYPQESSLIVFQITGDELLNILWSRVDDSSRFLTWSGVKVRAREGNVVSLTIDNIPVRMGEQFSVVTTNQVWDNFDALFGIPRGDRAFFNIPTSVREILVEFIESQTSISHREVDWWDVK